MSINSTFKVSSLFIFFSRSLFIFTIHFLSPYVLIYTSALIYVSRTIHIYQMHVSYSITDNIWRYPDQCSVLHMVSLTWETTCVWCLGWKKLVTNVSDYSDAPLKRSRIIRITQTSRFPSARSKTTVHLEMQATSQKPWTYFLIYLSIYLSISLFLNQSLPIIFGIYIYIIFRTYISLEVFVEFSVRTIINRQ